MKHYKLQNTGWSNGQDWFSYVQRFETYEEVKNFYDGVYFNDPDTHWRIAEIVFTKYREDESNLARVTREVTETRYLYLS